MSDIKRYLLFIRSDVDPSIIEPTDEQGFPTEADRDDVARMLKAEHGDNSGIFKLDILPPDCAPLVSAYSAGFFEDDVREGKEEEKKEEK